MTTVARRERGSFADVFDWLESEFAGLPVVPAFRPHSSAQTMRVEQFLEDGKYVLRVEAPGVDPDKDLQIAIDTGLLVIDLERRDDTKEGRHSEFRSGRFQRAVRLPDGAVVDEITAAYQDGILEITVPVKAPVQPEPKRIAVTKH